MDDIQEILQANTEESTHDDIDEAIQALEAFLQLSPDAQEHILEFMRELVKEDTDSTPTELA